MPVATPANKKLYESLAPPGTNSLMAVPEGFKFLERNSFIKSLTGVYSTAGRDFSFSYQELVNAAPIKKVLGNYHSPEADKLSQALNSYNGLHVRGARLPKFTRWLTSVFPDEKNIHNAVALAMQASMADSNNVVISEDPYALWNAGASSSYASCLKPGGERTMGYDPLRRLIEQAAGIGIAYILNNSNGQMKGRVFLHHVVDQETKRNGILVGPSYGCLYFDLIKDVLLSIKGVSFVMNAAWRRSTFGDGGYVPGKLLTPRFVDVPYMGHWDISNTSLDSATKMQVSQSGYFEKKV